MVALKFTLILLSCFCISQISAINIDVQRNILIRIFDKKPTAMDLIKNLENLRTQVNESATAHLTRAARFKEDLQQTYREKLSQTIPDLDKVKVQLLNFCSGAVDTNLELTYNLTVEKKLQNNTRNIIQSYDMINKTISEISDNYAKILMLGEKIYWYCIFYRGQERLCMNTTVELIIKSYDYEDLERITDNTVTTVKSLILEWEDSNKEMSLISNDVAEFLVRIVQSCLSYYK